jgi:hypothetical protein
MFETLEDMFEKSKHPLDRRLPVVMYGIYAILGLIALILGVRRHGFSQLFRLVVWAAIFLLSLTWLVASLRSAVPMTHRGFGVRNTILVLLLMAQDLAYT